MSKDSNLPKTQILIVDDEKDVKNLFEQKFRKEVRKGLMQLNFAFSGEEALGLLQAQKKPGFVLILSDINMPGMNGLLLLEKIKEKFPDIKVFMITAYGDQENYNQAISLGADDFINKPVDFNNLKEKVLTFSAMGETLKEELQEKNKSKEEPDAKEDYQVEDANDLADDNLSEVNDELPQILVVDDEPDLETLVRQKFRKQIKNKKIKFHFAQNGEEALEVLKENKQIDMVISDINMPKMDGLTLIGHIHDLSPVLKSVIVSAYGDMEKIRTAMNKGAFDFLTKPINFDDLQQTIHKTLETVNQIKASLKSMQENNILKMYVDQSVIKFVSKREQEKNLNKRDNIVASVLFIDICSFTTISETESAERVFDLLNYYFDMIVFEVLARNGIVDKFIGDAVMAVFRNLAHIGSAVQAALSIRKKIKSLNYSLEKEIGFSPNVSIGLNTGRMVAGNLGAQSVNRYDFTVIGDSVNTAARLQGIAGPGDIIITEQIRQKLGDEFQFEDRGIHRLKGKSEPVQLHNILDYT